VGHEVLEPGRLDRQVGEDRVEEAHADQSSASGVARGDSP
jgi:hypothetical protein